MLGLIVAYSKNKAIGHNGRIPWDIDGEKKRFKKLTMGNVVIMGRRTYEEIGRPLPGRYTIVVSSTKSFEFDNCTTVASLGEAMDKAVEKFGHDKDVFIAGGAALYKEAIGMVKIMYITEIDDEFEGDTFFAEFDENEFHRFEIERVNGAIPFTYVTYVRK